MFKVMHRFPFPKSDFWPKKISIIASVIGFLALVSSTAAIFGWLPLNYGPAGFIIFFLCSAVSSWAE